MNSSTAQADAFRTHLCLVSQQGTPNFLPVLDSRTRPDEVILVVSPDMRARAAWLRAAIEARGVRVSECAIADPWNIASVQDALLDLLSARAGSSIALNITGGTKPMAIAAQEVFRAEGYPVFYVHPERNEILPLWTGGAPIPIEERVGIAEYLSIHGFTERDRDRREFPERYHVLCDEWVNEVERFAESLRKLNRLAQEARARLEVEMGRWARDERLREVVDKLDRHGIAVVDGERLCFPDESARFFANGGWLELHVARAVEDLGREVGVQDSARSLKVRSAGGAGNEMDVAFLAHNRLFLVECKSRQMGGDEEAGPGAEALYKLDTLTAMGGLNTRGMLVSYQAVEAWDKRRAADLRIRIVEAGQLRNLHRHLCEWMQP
jgi:hypothetical protein